MQLTVRNVSPLIDEENYNIPRLRDFISKVTKLFEEIVAFSNNFVNSKKIMYLHPYSSIS